MSFDLTADFRSRVAVHEARRPIRAQAGAAKDGKSEKSSIMKAADHVAGEIRMTTRRLAGLAKLMRDGRHLPGTASRVSSLASTIKEDVTRLNVTLDRMERAAAAQKEAAVGSSTSWLGSAATSDASAATTKTEAAHGEAIVSSLKHSLLSTTAGLQELLSSHTTSLTAVSERRGRIGIRPSAFPAVAASGAGRAGAAAATHQPPRVPSQQQPDRSRPAAAPSAPTWAAVRPDAGDVDVESAFGAVSASSLEAGATAQLDRRSEDMLAIQQSTADVAQLFKRLAGIVSEQSEQVRAVEDRLDASLDALEKGEHHLERAKEASGSNTLLAMQITGVLMAAIIAFLLFAS